jgi:predicted acyltransferase
LVDYPGSEEHTYWPLKHAEWNGWTLADLVFPSFLFLVGVAVELSVSSRLSRGMTREQIFWQAVRRSVLLIVLGIVLNGFPKYDLATLRLEGVIQRIAVCYLAAVVLRLWFGWRVHVLVICLCLLGYWVLLRWVPIPGVGTPGQDFPFLDPDRNLTAWIDRSLFAGRLYNGTRDPEGLLSTVPAIATTLIGLCAGQWLKTNQPQKTKVSGLIVAGLAGLVFGVAWSGWFPINKNLWTSSYVLLSAGVALCVFAGLYLVIECKGWSGRWTVPFLVFGTNAILGFVLDMLLYAPMYYGHVQTADGRILSWREYVYAGLASYFSPANASLAYAIGVVCFACLLLWIAYRRRIFVKI